MGSIITRVIYEITISLYGGQQNEQPNEQRSPKIQRNDICNSIHGSDDSFSSDDYVIFGNEFKDLS